MSLLRYAKLNSAAIVICRLLAADAQALSHATEAARVSAFTASHMSASQQIHSVGGEDAPSMNTSNSSIMRTGDDATSPTASVNATLMYERSPPTLTSRVSSYMPTSTCKQWWRKPCGGLNSGPPTMTSSCFQHPRCARMCQIHIKEALQLH